MPFVVLASDWDSLADPVRIFGDDQSACIDFDNQGYKPRTVLRETSRKTMTDCEHGIQYHVVICDLRP